MPDVRSFMLNLLSWDAINLITGRCIPLKRQMKKLPYINTNISSFFLRFRQYKSLCMVHCRDATNNIFWVRAKDIIEIKMANEIKKCINKYKIQNTYLNQTTILTNHFSHVLTNIFEIDGHSLMINVTKITQTNKHPIGNF